MTNTLTKNDITSLLKEFELFLEKKTITSEQPCIPIHIFSQKLSPFETVVKYLVENLHYNYSESGRLLKKDRQVINEL